MKHPALKLTFLFLLSLAVTTLYLVYRSEQKTITREQQELTAPDTPVTAPPPDTALPPAVAVQNEPVRQEEPAEPEKNPEPVSPTEDEVVTTDFLSDLATFALAHFHPAGTVHNPGSTPILTLSIKSVNMRYGIHLFGLGHEQEGLLAARKEILGYILRTSTLDMLSGMYMDRLREELVLQAGEATRLYATDGGETERVLDDADINTFLNLLADKVEETGRVLDALSISPAPLELLDVHRDAVRQVNAAHARFWGREDKLMPLEADRAAEEIKSAILTRERVKEEYLSTIRNTTALGSLSEQEVFYLGQWTARRVAEDREARTTVQHLGSLLVQLAKHLRVE